MFAGVFGATEKNQKIFKKFENMYKVSKLSSDIYIK